MPVNLHSHLEKINGLKAEPDGSHRGECPVCGADGKDPAQDKLRIFPNGAFSCVRFATVGDEAKQEHNQEILRAVGASGAPSPFISVTLLDGRLTLDTNPAGRGKFSVTARNCDRTLHMDTISLAAAGDREKFLRALELEDSERKIVRQAFIDLADRATSAASAVATEEKPDVKEVGFIVLSDGRIAEQTLRGFALYDPSAGTTEYTGRIADGDIVYMPLADDFLKAGGGMYMPSAVEEYGSEKELDREIEEYLHRYIDLPARELKLSAKYIRLTYMCDKLQELSYLRATGERGNGKSRFILATGLACYRPVILVNISAAVLYRMVDQYHPTLIIDEANSAQDSDDAAALLQVLNAGFQRGAKVMRCDAKASGGYDIKTYDPFGAKIIASLKTGESQAFESRCIRVLMERTHRKDIKLRMSDAMFKAAESLRNKLTLWRLRNWQRDFEAELDRAEDELKAHRIDPRYIQIAVPLYALLQDESLKAEFVAMLKSRDEADAEERHESLDGQIVGILHDLLFEVVEDGTVRQRTAENILPPADGLPCELLPVETITDRLNEDLSDKKKHQVKWIGKQIRKLELRTKEVSRRASDVRKKSCVVYDRQRLETLFLKSSYPLSPDFHPVNPASLVTIFPDNSLTRPDEDKSNQTEIASSDHVKANEENSLTAVAGLAGRKIGEEGVGHLEEGISALPATGRMVALDTETEAFDKRKGVTHRTAKMIGLSLSYDGAAAEYVTDTEAWPMLMPEQEETVIFHNAKFDLGVLERAGLPLPAQREDTLIAAHLLDETGKHGLKDLAAQHLGVTNPLTFEEADRMKLLNPEVFAEYARNDARYTFRLWQLFKPELERQGLMPVYEMEKRLVPVVRAMESAGMKLDAGLLETLSADVAAEQTRLRAEVFELAGCEFDLNAPAKVAAILYDKLGLKCQKKTDNGQRSVDVEALKELAHPVAVKLLEFRQIDKLANTFVNVLPTFADAGSRIHPEFKSLGAVTGRFSCCDPNVQQIPARSELGKRLRAAFIAENGNKLIVADYSQMELRVLAHYSADPLLIEAYTAAEETDLHTLTARRMFKQQDVTKEQRAIAKMLNFGIVYGISATGLFRRLHMLGIKVTEGECESYIKTYFKTYKEVADFLMRAERRIKSRKHVETIHGRRRRLSGKTKREVRQAQNFIIQATAADIFKTALIAVHESLPEDASIVAQIHDEIIIECRAEIAEDVHALTVAAMQQAPDGFKVPMRVDAHIVDRWSEAK
jgi:DNA polymerase I-like protein with 3'-5' exonuclease and polymerase domains